ncbi:uncharacterized protein B0I36DRAFT_395711 [Microdochium trichocladiopsis]|uniref:Uncharacterized protein n=1 Tax=Microdochium trichocladiopsis TaxID=1682393 RepID=A0A9P8XVT4_9PEZI|nr:uncharacterized protein B0I36DRAFT_395711 [Microdochium trichocladiopsis]KAH7016040.1 hypothetical protein B0I36DRAFT_395711 [Microdochium trichocladiopsis]
MRARILRHLGLFKRVLEEEEKHAPEYQSKELSKLVERSETEGTMWYHMVLQGFFHGPGSLPWEQLKDHTPDWDLLAAGIPEEDIRSFVAAKMEHLKLHDERLKKTEITYDEMLAGKWSIQGFIDEVEAPYKHAAEIPEEGASGFTSAFVSSFLRGHDERLSPSSLAGRPMLVLIACTSASADEPHDEEPAKTATLAGVCARFNQRRGRTDSMSTIPAPTAIDGRSRDGSWGCIYGRKS